jgi:hypothetical protein
MRNAEGFSQARSTIYQVELWIYTPQWRISKNINYMEKYAILIII